MHFGENVVTRIDAASGLGEQEQEFVLAGSQGQRAAFEKDATLLRRNFWPAISRSGTDGLTGSECAARHGLETGEQPAARTRG